MTREELYSFISEKYEGLKQALKGTDLERIKELNIPEFTTIMRSGAVFFSNNKSLNLVNPEVNRIVSIIKPFSDRKNLKIAVALYQLTVHSEDAYATVTQICDKSGILAERVKDCLEGEFAPFILEKEGTEREYRFDWMYMNILPILSLIDLK